MKNSVKLALKASEIRSEINKLDPGEGTIERRRELLGNLDTVESEYRTALTAEAEADAAAPDANGITAEEREFRALDSKAELRNAVFNVLNGKELEGAERELQQHRGLSATEIPWDMIAPRAADRRGEEHRVDAVTPAPGTVHDNQRTPLGRVFSRSATAALGVEMPGVPTGDVNVPVLSGTQAASVVAKDGSVGDAAAGTLTARRMSPTRLQFEYIMRREDRARMLGLDQLLRNDISMAIADVMDAQVLAGDGTNPNFDGFLATAANGGLPDLTAHTTTVTYAASLVELARGVDGDYAGSIPECSIVVGDDTYRALAALVNTGSGETAAGTFHRQLRNFMASSNIPAPSSDNQEGILARRGIGGNALAPVWGGLTLLIDEVSDTNRKQGWISITGVMLCDFKILRFDGFTRVTFHLG